MDVAASYTRFAREEARSKSPTYERLALEVVGSAVARELLESLPPAKRQPNLLFASIRYLGGDVSRGDHVDVLLRRDFERIRQCMLQRSTQTNEPGRCATLLPYLAPFEEPIALIEVGAAGGLCIYPDQFEYDYGGVRVISRDPRDIPRPRFPCAVSDRHLVPQRVPDVAFRAGVDLHPVDLSDESHIRWLTALVWPEHAERAARLRLAIDTVAALGPHVVQGDLIDTLPDLVHRAAPHGRVVVFHSAVLCYLPATRRAEFQALVRSLPVTWISNEAPGVVAGLDAPSPPDKPSFLVAVDGRTVAYADPHGAWLEPIA